LRKNVSNWNKKMARNTPCQSSKEAKNNVSGPDHNRCSPGKYLEIRN
jgi:hypothetical protein